jgi:phosphatidylinositol glycan class N
MPIQWRSLLAQIVELKLNHTLLFKPWRGKTLDDGFAQLEEISRQIQDRHFETAIENTMRFIQDSLKSLSYYQTYYFFYCVFSLLLNVRYDRTLLLFVTTLNYLGWIINILLLVLQNYSVYSKEISSLKLISDPMVWNYLFWFHAFSVLIL